MAKVNVYLNFDGNCLEAFNFYKSVFGGEFSYVGKFSEMPSQPGIPSVPENEKDKLMHIGLPISEETALMGSDIVRALGHKFDAGNNFSISINADNRAEADRLFGSLSAGGKITMPMTDTFWGSYFGMFTDKFGINWMVSFDQAPVN